MKIRDAGSGTITRMILAAAMFGMTLSAITPSDLQAQEDLEVVKLSPQIRELPLGSSAPSIPRARIEKFLAGNRIVEPAVFEAAPYILASASGNLVIGAGDEVYLQGDWENPVSSYDIYRPGNIYKDPVSEEALGMEVVHLGSVNVTGEAKDGIRTGVIRNNRLELRAGDRLLPREPGSLEFTFYPERPDSDVSGSIIGMLGNTSMAAQYDAVVLNLGQRDGLEPGTVLGIYEAGVAAMDPVTGETVTLPGKEVGELMIYRSFDKLSYGLILDSTQPASLNYAVRAR